MDRTRPDELLVNDVHSRLNATRVSRIELPETVDDVRELVRRASRDGVKLCVSGGRHAMGGQQFRTGQVLIDTRRLNGMVNLDRQRGLLRIGAGAQWPEVIAATRADDGDSGPQWGIRQKQTGADSLTLGGSIACNGHGRGLEMGPLVEDIESLVLVNATGEVVECDRTRTPELFSLVVGGYGLFGVVIEVTLRLSPRRKMRRLVDIIDLEDAANAVYRKVDAGCVYGDFQYAIDPGEDSFLRRGVFACYRPVADHEPVTDADSDLARDDWLKLLALAHTDKRRAFQLYSEHYLRSHGRVYWSDTMQLSTYIPSYSEFLAELSGGARAPESLVISELYVAPSKIMAFMDRARAVLRELDAEDIYGTIRAIQADTTTFLAWAREHAACVIFNLRTPHAPEGIARSAAASRSLIDAAADLGGSFFLTYHRWATREQVLRCYPTFPAFLRKKLEHDPRELFQSDWYCHYRDVLGAS